MKLTERIKFKNADGYELSALLELPETAEIKGYALFAHCFTCNKNLTAVRNIGNALVANGIAVLRFDFTGLGESEGDFENTNFSSNVEDLIAAANFLSTECKSPAIIIGHSLGGAAVIFASKSIPSIKAIVTIGAPSDPEHVLHLLQSGIEQIEDQGEALVSIGGREFTVKKHFLDDLKTKNLPDVVRQLRLPILVLHSPQDTTVGIENASNIYQAAWHPKSFISLDGADHLLSKKEDSLYVGTMIGAWASRYI